MLPALRLILGGFCFVGYLTKPTYSTLVGLLLFTVMGNFTGKKDEAGPSGTKYEDGHEEYMEYEHGGVYVNYRAHSPRAHQSPLMFTPQVPIGPLQSSDDMMRTHSNENIQRGNIFNVLDVQDYVPPETQSPPSPISSYDSSPFSTHDFNEKVPELPPLLQKSPLEQSSYSKDSLESVGEPLAAVLDHLYIQGSRTDQSIVALSSTKRFDKKYVTLVRYKSLPKGRN